MNTAIFRCTKKDEMYLYLHLSDEVQTEPTAEQLATLLEHVPESLKHGLGKLMFVMVLNLNARDKLARANIDEVKLSLASKGYFLQLPPDGLINQHAPAPEGLRGA